MVTRMIYSTVCAAMFAAGSAYFMVGCITEDLTTIVIGGFAALIFQGELSRTEGPDQK